MLAILRGLSIGSRFVRVIVVVIPVILMYGRTEDLVRKNVGEAKTSTSGFVMSPVPLIA